MGEAKRIFEDIIAAFNQEKVLCLQKGELAKGRVRETEIRDTYCTGPHTGQHDSNKQFQADC